MTDTDSLPLNPALRDFLSLNPDLSLQTADLDRPDAVARLKFGSGDPQALLDNARAHQSIAALTSDPELADALYDQNLRSAAAIAALPLVALRARLPTAKQEASAADRSDQDAVATLHARAVDVHSRAVHLFSALTSVLSPHAKAQPANHLVASFEAEFGHLPSFAQLFGSQDYIPAPHCQSVLGPSAYFLDLMRVVDENITSNTANTIPPDLALRKRRAGLYTQDLTCAETNTLVPKIAIVNQVVADFLKPVVGDDTDYVIATSVFPANLPINVPLERMRAAMNALGASLPALYTAYRFRGQGDSPLPDEGSILAARLGLSPEQRAITQTPRTGTDLAAFFGGGAELLAPPVATKVTISKTSLTVTGTGFNAAAKPGTILRVGATLRAVVTITSDTSLQCDQAWPDDAKDADGLFYPVGSLSTASLLTTRMHIDDAALNALFTQDLDDTERGAGLDKYLYVNGSSSAPGLALITDRTDVSYSLAVIGGLDDARLDRVNRIARLAAITGVPARDLAFALWASGATDFDAAGLAAVAKTVLLARDLSIPVVEAVGLWSVLKTWGRGEGPAPADLFDTIFNATATNPSGGTGGFYRPVYTPNPLFKSDVTTWTLAASDAKGQEIRTWLSTALRVPVKDLLLIAAQVATGASSLPLDVPVLSALWARARLARALGISAPDLLAIMTLAGVSRISDPADVAQIATLKRFLDERGFALADLAYVVGGDPGGKTGVVRAKDIAPFLAALRVSAAEWLLSPASFSGPGGADTGARIFDTLAVNKIIDRYGTVLFPDWKLVFAVLNAVFPVSARQFPVPGLISNDQAIAAYNDLVKHKVVLGNGLAYPVDATTDLSFLFPEVTDKDVRDAMIESIRSVLNGITRDVELSIAVCKPALRTQHEGLYGELGVLLQIEPAAAATIVTSGFAVAFPNADPVQLLLTPLGTPEALSPPLVLAGRVSFLATLLGLTPADLSDAAAKPRAFGLASLQSLGMADVASWSDYATLVASAPREAVEQRAVAAYLTKGDVAALSAATGWDPQGFSTLAAALWGSSFVLAPSQLWQIRTCFDLAGIMGTDTGACTAIAAIARAPALAGTPPPPAWTTYKDAAATLTAMLKAKSSSGDWAAISKPVNDRTELARRDGLVALAVWTVAQSSLKIETPRGLSEYLLIDVEISACDTTSAIVEATAAAQTYLQRCRMSLEPGIVSLGAIAEVWWSWLTNYRVWEANRSIFLYPESYIDPNLRRDRTDLFQKLQEELQQSAITPASVERAFTNYLTSFADLAKLLTVDSTRSIAPHPISGTPVETVFFLGRTEAKPYQYYYRTLRAGNIWSQWIKIDVAMTSPDATIVFAFHRLFLFWVEDDAVRSSFIKDANQKDKTSRRANIMFAFQRLDATWSAPQSVEAGYLFDAQPTLYANNIINPDPSAPPASGVDAKMPYWHRVFVQPVPGPDGSSKLLITFGNAYRVPDKPDVPPPDVTKIDTSDERVFVSNVYRASQIGKAFAIGAQGMPVRQGSAYLSPAVFMDAAMNVESIAAFLPDFTSDPTQKPFTFLKTFNNGVYLLGPNNSRSILLDAAFVDSPDYPERVPNAPVPMIVNIDQAAKVIPVKNLVGTAIFDNGDEAFLMTPRNANYKPVESILDLGRTSINVQTLDNKTVAVACEVVACGPYSSQRVDPSRIVFDFTRLTTSAVGRLVQVMTFGGIDALLSVKTQEASGPASLDFTRFYRNGQKPVNVGPPATMNGGAVDFQGAYRPYFEEIFFQAPFFIAAQLSAAQHHEDAKGWYEYIFDPAALAKGQTPPDGDPSAVYWQYLPFRGLTPKSLIDNLTDQTAIEAWNANPFDPFTVAQLRPVAFEKTIVLHYISNILDWADACFARDTRESFNQATLLYLTAANLLGARPARRGIFKAPPPLNFDKIKADYGQIIPQFLIALERVLPKPVPGNLPLEPAPFNMISAYFTVPESGPFLAYWDRLEASLYKVRNCLSLSGQPRTLALFDAPLNPNNLVRGGGFPGVANQGGGNAPVYRFQVMADRAAQMAQMSAGFGAALLAALEKRDAESLQMLRTRQERAVLVQTGNLKAQLVDEATSQLEAARQAKLAAQERQTHYADLLSAGLTAAEITSMTTMILANVFKTTSSVISALSGGAHLAPNVGSPFAMTYGGREIGSSLSSFSSVSDIVAGSLEFASALSGVIAAYERREQEWTLQRNVAGYEVAQMDAQIAAATSRLESLKLDVALTKLMVVQNDEIQKVLTSKFTSTELYGWMASRLQALYYQSYKLALDLAMSAQRSYQYELDTSDSVLDFDYWEAGRSGLLAAEGLQLSLMQVERAYYVANRRRLKVDKVISLWALDPLALLTLKRTGSCTFDFSELLFDYDFPGQYCRKIERLSINVPAVVGPYQNLQGILTQTSNLVLVADNSDSVRFLLGQDVQPAENTIRLNARSGQQLVLSRSGDNGTLSGDPGEDRYLPFEGTGAVSSWRLDLPLGSNRIDFSSISDVVITLTYSAQTGGGTFLKTVLDGLANAYTGQASIALQQQFPVEWSRFAESESATPTMSFPLGASILPANLTAPQALKAYLQLDIAIPYTGDITLELTPPGGTPLTLKLSKTTPWASGAVDCVLSPPAAWTLKITQIPSQLAAGGKLKPGVLTGAVLVLDYSATVTRR